ncbi:Uncaracterized surface protein containing fasciclin (FAS1) repeats [Zhouia amylolytica]|uniref:Uncaracterized surface protein containing fasciclin (FAS1) repeats n=1 Tax=Zhouia amylolytica TaxID=376730 RepID=A0A1I6UZS6_9FLAO|nr:fasciclin domain-containing protein [Zhouia amylolytica]SFT06955.1 Uncaracterized surface protein containing fasciclin (FAS1) repeats [Zhouia amylolytica]
MKHLSKIIQISMLAFLLMLTSCNDDDDGGGEMMTDPTIAEIAATTPEFSSLYAALLKAGLAATLDSPGTYTVFAPTNTAFDNFLDANGIATIDDVPTDVLTNLLLNHVLSSEVTSSQITTGYTNSLATGPDDNNLSLFLDTTSGVEINGVASVANGGADVMASNGVVHVVDAVIPTPSVVDHALANDNFSTLVSALTRPSFGSTYTDLLSGTDASPFTVFAPTNEAFDNLLMALGANSLDDIDDETLQEVLNYHVIAGSNVTAGSLTDGQMATTFQGEDLTFDLSDGAKITDASDAQANIIATDVQCNNGIIHAVDKVLIPQTVWDAINPTIAGFVAMNEDYSSLLAAVQKAGLVDALNADDADLTVFAPNNAAFEAFLSANGFASLDDVPVDVVTQILLNHVISGVALSGDLSTMYANTLATNEDGDNLSIYINTDSGVSLNGVSEVTAADIEVRNGVIHAVDAVIGLPTIVTFATADPNFTSLVGALTADGQPDFVGILSGTTNAPFTVFAPVNSAFEALASVPSGDDLTAVLQHHVIIENNIRSEDLSDGASVATLEGDSITVTLPGTGDNIADLTDGSGNSGIGVIAVDVQATNGVIHAINAVLLPDTTN